MNAFTEKINVIPAGVSAVLAYFFGDYWVFFAAFLILNVVDYATGWAKAKWITKKLSSATGAVGILKKVGYWVVIGIAFFIAVAAEQLGGTIGQDLSFLHMLGYFTLATYIFNEIRSIIENLVVLGVEIPEPLTKGLSILDKILEEKTGGKSI